jgi:UDP-N-acetylglucosamine 1-carboxyvinyltransferase
MDKLEYAGLKFLKSENAIKVKYQKPLKPVSIAAHPYPGFPTDLQAQFAALMAMTPGLSVITDTVFPDRYMHVAELNRMGADIRREGNSAIVEGAKTLHGAPVMASDLRASAALVIAGLAAKGKTQIHRIYHLERGYEDLERKLTGLGAVVYRERE